MRFMIQVRATAVSEAGGLPDEQLMVAMADYHEQLMKAGVLLDPAACIPATRAGASTTGAMARVAWWTAPLPRRRSSSRATR